MLETPRSRRDLLKFFGVGATVIPVIGGAPEPDAAARLIEVPKVELITAATIPEPFDLANVQEISITFRLRDGTRRAAMSRSIQASGRLEPGFAIRLTVTSNDGTSPAVFKHEGYLDAWGGWLL
jgi:hypothetical protein